MLVCASVSARKHFFRVQAKKTILACPCTQQQLQNILSVNKNENQCNENHYFYYKDFNDFTVFVSLFRCSVSKSILRLNILLNKV